MLTVLAVLGVIGVVAFVAIYYEWVKERARRENRLPDAHRDLIEAVELFRQAGAQREWSRARSSLGNVERRLGLR